MEEKFLHFFRKDRSAFSPAAAPEMVRQCAHILLRSDRPGGGGGRVCVSFSSFFYLFHVGSKKWRRMQEKVLDKGEFNVAFLIRKELEIHL